ncbi:MAG: hypothetical protein OYL41_07995 [Acidobacteriota bacterium]|nr:hypothetical protein [Acidobacteriota bacterium]
MEAPILLRRSLGDGHGFHRRESKHAFNEGPFRFAVAKHCRFTGLVSDVDDNGVGRVGADSFNEVSRTESEGSYHTQ